MPKPRIEELTARGMSLELATLMGNATIPAGFNDPTSSVWALTGATLTPAQAGPFGDLDAYLLRQASGTSYHKITASGVKQINGVTYQYSAYIKAFGAQTRAWLANSLTKYAFVNMSTQSLQSSLGVTNASVTALADGWSLVKFELAASSSADTTFEVYCSDDAGNGSFAGSTSNGMYFAQPHCDVVYPSASELMGMGMHSELAAQLGGSAYGVTPDKETLIAYGLKPELANIIGR